MGGGRRPGSRAAGTSFRNAVLAAARGGLRFAARRAAARSRVAVPRPGPDARRVIVKAHIVRMNASGAKAAMLHLRYIVRDGVDRDGSKGVLYTADGPAQVEAFEEARRGEQHQFRLIISPEDANELDLTDYVRRLMATVERDLGRKLEWAAVNHFDTQHPHAHVVIRGVDLDGREVRLDRGYLFHGLRGRAQQLATDELGPRPELDVHRAHAREVTQGRFTSLDRELERRARDDRVEVRSRAPKGRIDESTLLARLEHLEGLRLAERVGPTAWALAPGWQTELRELGSRGDILQQIHKAVSGDRSRYHIVRPGQALDANKRAIFGRVASKGLSDELKGAFYAVIETPTGHAYHVPLDARAAESLCPGDIVSLTTKPEPPVRPIDRQIADAARAGGGLYILEPATDPASHPHARRLRDLERLGLARPEAPDRWRVSPNLLEELEQRNRAAPARHRLFVRKEPLPLPAQVRHPGPVWLDRLEPDSFARYGFGGQVRRALEQRREALRDLGIRPDDPSRFPKLRELERRAMGREIAARSGQAFVPVPADGFRGRVQPADGTPAGASYVVVSDGMRFAVLRSNASLRAAIGKAVTLTRDAKGRVLVRTDPEKEIG